MTRPNDDERYDPIADRARALPASIEPPRDLWPSIERGLGVTAGRQWSTARLATAAVFLIGLSSMLTLWMTDQFEGAESVELAKAPPVVPFGPWFASGTDVAQTRSEMVHSVRDQLALLSPGTEELVNTNFRGVESARRDINSALHEHPSDPLLQQLLLSTYTNEMKILSDIGGMTRSVAY